MCLLIFAHRADPRYPLVLAGNRDEFHDRPTAAAEFWPDKPGLLAGRDLEQGGTWMGITRGGRFAAITNYRDPARTAPAPRSRGELPLNYLVGTQEPGEYLQGLLPVAEAYAGFNLLVGVVGELWYLTNSLPAGNARRCACNPAFTGSATPGWTPPGPRSLAVKAGWKRCFGRVRLTTPASPGWSETGNLRTRRI